MNLNAVCVVIMNDGGDGVKLVIDGHDLALAWDRIDEDRFAFPLLVGIVPVLVKTQ